MDWLVIFAVVFANVLAVVSIFISLRATEAADQSVREAKLRAGVGELHADLALLSDTVSRQGNSLAKIRNRLNADHAREKRNGGDRMSDDEFLKAVETGRLKL